MIITDYAIFETPIDIFSINNVDLLMSFNLNINIELQGKTINWTRVYQRD